MKTTIYTQLFNASEKHVKSFRTDFDIDKKIIAKNPQQKFIHIAREHGTSLINFFKGEEYPGPGEKVKYLFSVMANRKQLLNSNRKTLEYYLYNNPLKIHYFNGETLKAVSKDKALQIYGKYYRSLLNKWEEEENNFKN